MIEMGSATRTRLRGRELRGNGDAGWNGVDCRFLPAFAGMTGNDGKGHSRLDRGKDGWGHEEPRLGGKQDGRHADAGAGVGAGAPARLREGFVHRAGPSCFAPARQCPERPPDFSIRRTPVTTIPRSAALHMS